MKKSNIIASSAAAAVALVAVAGLAASSFAASSTATTDSSGSTTLDRPMFQRGERMENFKEMTDEEREAMKTKQEAVRAALEAGDYNAWVAAVKAINENSRELKNVTADNFSAYVEKFKQREADSAARQAGQDAIKAALDAGDYNTWVAAVKAINEDSNILEKITADNFSKYVEAHKLKTQANDILKELGITGPEMNGFGIREGQGMGRHFGGPNEIENDQQ